MSNSMTLWTVAHQAPLVMLFSSQEYWSELSCPSRGDISNPGIEPTFLMFPALAGGFFTSITTRYTCLILYNIHSILFNIFYRAWALCLKCLWMLGEQRGLKPLLSRLLTV